LPQRSPAPPDDDEQAAKPSATHAIAKKRATGTWRRCRCP
jgi:hypothetical protein